MLRLNTIRRQPGATQVTKRIGRGIGSKYGQTAGKGGKGQTARKGSSIRIGFEGGQWPIYRRMPKRGFKNVLRNKRTQINLDELELASNGQILDLALLKVQGLARNNSEFLAVLGLGEVKKAVHVKAHKFSDSAKKKIEAAGGKAEQVFFPMLPLRKRIKKKKAKTT